MTDCSYCGKEIFDYNAGDRWMKNASDKHYHEGCRRITHNLKDRIRRAKKKLAVHTDAKELKQAAETITQPPSTKELPSYKVTDRPFMTDEEWWNSIYYKKMKKVGEKK